MASGPGGAAPAPKDDDEDAFMERWSVLFSRGSPLLDGTARDPFKEVVRRRSQVVWKERTGHRARYQRRRQLRKDSQARGVWHHAFLSPAPQPAVMAKMAEGYLPAPPGFEDLVPAQPGYEDLDPAELDEFRRFMAGAPSAAPKKAVSALVGEQEAVVEFVTPADGSGVESGPLDMDASFEDLGLRQELVQGVFELGFVRPSRIQAAALPHICPPKSANMIAQAQNGTGKTATFALALLNSIDMNVPRPQALVLNPTRELAKQTEQVVAQLGQYMSVRTLLVVPSMENVDRNAECHVLIGTPGKTLALCKKRVLDIACVKVFVLDEADLMLDNNNQMGPQITQIQRMLPEGLQVLFFSATYPDEVMDFALTQVPRALTIKVKKSDLTVTTVSQMYLSCWDDRDKFKHLCSLYAAMNVGQSVIFLNTRKKAFQLAKDMREAGHSVSLICGTQISGEERISPEHRDWIMEEFRSGVTRVLITTDVLCRGIDVPQVTLVVNYQLPINFSSRSVCMETYLHRVGRTGRFGLKGIAINMVTEDERRKLDEVCSFFACTISQVDADFDAVEEKLRALR